MAVGSTQVDGSPTASPTEPSWMDPLVLTGFTSMKTFCIGHRAFHSCAGPDLTGHTVYPSPQRGSLSPQRQAKPIHKYKRCIPTRM